LKGARRREKEESEGRDSTARMSLAASLRPYASNDVLSGEKEDTIGIIANK
jgi:hypothetical protein